jgi:hypothetical protein
VKDGPTSKMNYEGRVASIANQGSIHASRC